ncbi:MAG: hypothetical protein ACLFST_02215 [Spirochaetia bacterium]
MTHEAKITTDHNTIRTWVEDRGGKPAKIKDTGSQKDPGVLRIDFPDYGAEEPFEHIDWDSFFDKFESSNLAFLYQDETKEGGTSRFSKLVSRDVEGNSGTTRDHQKIKDWTEERGGKPAKVKGTQASDDDPGILRIDFPGYGADEKLEHISWEEFFQKFDQAGIWFLYQNRTKDGSTSRFSKFIEG